MIRALKVTAWLLFAVILLGGAVLGEAHLEIRGLAPVLPDRAELDALLGAGDGPVRVSYVNTATQKTPGQPATAFPAFVLEWADGRLFVIDTGMEREGALAFGKPLEFLVGADPIAPHPSLGQQLDKATSRVRGVAFTHLHSDHTGGLGSLCERSPGAMRELPIFQTPWQATLGNHTTRPGREHIEMASCAVAAKLDDGSLTLIPGFPGLAALAAGGHTPGSTIYFARLAGEGGRTWVFSGDITNSKEASLENRPKARIYSLLVVPEAPEHLETLRRWLASLDAEPDTTVVVSHDGDALPRSGIPPWPRRDQSALP